MAKKRTFRALIGIEGGGYMLLSRAEQKVVKGHAVIVNGLVRFLKVDSHPGYDAAPGYTRFGGALSFDAKGKSAARVIQFFRPKFEC